MAQGTNVTVAVVGTGIGGCELAGYLGLHGARVRVHDVRPEAVRGISEQSGLQVEGVLRGFAPVELATTDLAAAVEGADLVAVTTLNNDHEAVAAGLAPLLRDGQAVCLIPGCVGGALQFRHTLARLGCSARVAIGEVDNFPFTGLVQPPAGVHLASIKRRFLVAALPGPDGGRVVALVQQVLPPAVRADSVLQTGLGTMNPVVHVPGMLANIGRLDAGEPFQFYGQGLSQSVTRIVEALDIERLAVARRFGVNVASVFGWLASTYGLEGGTLHELLQRLHREIFKDSPAPDRLDHRYVTEDVPYGLVPLAELGRAAGVPTPVADALITLASTSLRRDFRAEGRNLKSMGLGGMPFETLVARLAGNIRS
ncbi:MAG: NAD/NADP octopine/nopaline dehydrogenase family protein [Chloroflexi bacterium]|nr:NAD/NADP octopine/nopaline dehydrogenase family protein [Chloroflexota bacterium]